MGPPHKIPQIFQGFGVLAPKSLFLICLIKDQQHPLFPPQQQHIKIRTIIIQMQSSPNPKPHPPQPLFSGILKPPFLTLSTYVLNKISSQVNFLVTTASSVTTTAEKKQEQDNKPKNFIITAISHSVTYLLVKICFVISLVWYIIFFYQKSVNVQFRGRKTLQL